MIFHDKVGCYKLYQEIIYYNVLSQLGVNMQVSYGNVYTNIYNNVGRNTVQTLQGLLRMKNVFYYISHTI